MVDGDSVGALPTVLSLCSLVLAQEHLSVSHNNLTTLHGELSSLPSLRVSAEMGRRAREWGPESSGWCEGRSRPHVDQPRCLSNVRFSCLFLKAKGYHDAPWSVVHGEKR